MQGAIPFLSKRLVRLESQSVLIFAVLGHHCLLSIFVTVIFLGAENTSYDVAFLKIIPAGGRSVNFGQTMILHFNLALRKIP